MNKNFTILGAVSAAFASLALVSAGAEPLSSDDFGKFPELSSVSMSLEGDMLVAVVSDPSKPGKQRAAAFWDLPDNNADIDTSQPLPPTAITPTTGKSKFYAASALKQKKSLWFTVQQYTGALLGCGEGKTTGSTKKYIQKIYMGNDRIEKIDDLPGGRVGIGGDKMLERCFELNGDTSIASLLPLHPTDIVLRRFTVDDGEKFYRHNLVTGRETFIIQGDDTEEFSISGKTGEVSSRTELVYESSEGGYFQLFKLKDPNTKKFTVEEPLTISLKDRHTMNVFGSIEGTDKYWVATDKFTDKVTIFEYDVVTNQFSDQPVIAHPEFNISNMIFSQREEDFGTPLGFVYDADIPQTYWIDPEMDSIQKGLEAAYPGKHVELTDWTPDRNRILFTVNGSDMPDAFFLLLDKSKVAILGLSRPWLDNDQLGKTELVYYTARDGLEIPALLTLPPGYQKGQKVRGAIVHPHGGPWARDFGGFDASGWTGYFASRGYAILQPQYRGSDGWGRKLWLAGDKEWGQKMQDDKDDGAAWLVSEGYVDPDKLAIHGYSYGGFAAIAASVRPNSPYQCAIAGAGVSNLTKLGNNWGDNRIQREFQGHTVTGMDPMQNTDKINIPILLYHGDYDVRVPDWHSRDFYNKIKNKSPQSELLILEKMGHQSNKWLPEHKETVLIEMERFLNTTCGM